MKLNKEIREAICKNAMAKTGLIQELKALAARYAAFAENCRKIANDGIKDSVIEKAEAAIKAKIPEKLLNNCNSVVRRDDDILINMQGMKFRPKYNGSTAIPDYTTERLYVSSSSICGPSIYKYCPSSSTTVIDDAALIQEFHDLERAKEDIADRILKAKQYVSGYVNSVTTAEKLVKVWPEAEALIPKETVTPVISNLPAIPVAELNKMFNLP